MSVRALTLLVLLAAVATARPSQAQRQRSMAPRSSASALQRPVPAPPVRTNKLAAARVAQAAVAKGKGRIPSTGKVIIDIGGEGAHKGAINLNPNLWTTTTGTSGRPIPNLVMGVAEQLPFQSHSADTLIVESAPLRLGSATELARVIRPGGTIRLVHPSAYAASAHQGVIDAVGGAVVQTVHDGITTTIIVVSPSPVRAAAAR